VTKTDEIEPNGYFFAQTGLGGMRLECDFAFVAAPFSGFLGGAENTEKFF
jgi:hypothetical protein